jgi:hypothetical protein
VAAFSCAFDGDGVCVSGKGPQKEMYQKKISQLQWKKVEFCLPWLTAEDYPLLLGNGYGYFCHCCLVINVFIC